MLICAHINIHVKTCVYMQVCTHVYTHVYTNAYTHLYTHLYTHVYTFPLRLASLSWAAGRRIQVPLGLVCQLPPLGMLLSAYFRWHAPIRTSACSRWRDPIGTLQLIALTRLLLHAILRPYTGMSKR